MSLPNTESLTAGFPLVIPTGGQQPTARLVLRNDRGQVVQQWLIKQNKCTLGSATGCALRCELNGIAPYHALLVLGSRQIFIRALAPKLTRNGRPFNEILLTDDESHFEIAGHRFELSRSAESLRTGAQANGSKPERLKFTLARPFELSQRTAPATTVVSAANRRNDSSTSALSSADTQWVAKLIRSAVEPLESQLHNLVEPLAELTAESRKFRRLQNKWLSDKQLPAEPPVAAPPSAPIVDPKISQQVEDLVVKHATSMEILTERISDVNQQLSAIERIIAEERAESQAAPELPIDPRIEQQSLAVEQLQAGMGIVSETLQRLHTQQLQEQGQDQQFQSGIQAQLLGLSEVMASLSTTVAEVHRNVVDHQEQLQLKANSDPDAPWKSNVQTQLSDLSLAMDRLSDELTSVRQEVVRQQERPLSVDTTAVDQQWKDQIQDHLLNLSQVFDTLTGTVADVQQTTLQQLNLQQTAAADKANDLWRTTVEGQFSSLTAVIAGLSSSLSDIQHKTLGEIENQQAILRQLSDSPWQGNVERKLQLLTQVVEGLAESLTAVQQAVAQDKPEPQAPPDSEEMAQWKLDVRQQLTSLTEVVSGLATTVNEVHQIAINETSDWGASTESPLVPAQSDYWPNVDDRLDRVDVAPLQKQEPWPAAEQEATDAEPFAELTAEPWSAEQPDAWDFQAANGLNNDELNNDELNDDGLNASELVVTELDHNEPVAGEYVESELSEDAFQTTSDSPLDEFSNWDVQASIPDVEPEADQEETAFNVFDSWVQPDTLPQPISTSSTELEVDYDSEWAQEVDPSWDSVAERLSKPLDTEFPAPVADEPAIETLLPASEVSSLQQPEDELVFGGEFASLEIDERPSNSAADAQIDLSEISSPTDLPVEESASSELSFEDNSVDRIAEEGLDRLSSAVGGELPIVDAEEAALPSWWRDDENDAVDMDAHADTLETSDNFELGAQIESAPAESEEFSFAAEDVEFSQQPLSRHELPVRDQDSEEFFGLAQLDPQDYALAQELNSLESSPAIPQSLELDDFDRFDGAIDEPTSAESEELIGMGVEPIQVDELATEPTIATSNEEELSLLDDSSPVALGSPDDALTSASESGSEEDDSVEDYMRKLLARMRGVPEEEVELPKPTVAPKAAAAPPVTERATPATSGPQSSNSGQRTTTSALSTELDALDVTEPFDPEKYMPRALAPERTGSMAAMRELANSSARTAIHKSTRQRHVTSIILKLVIAIVGMVVGVILVAINGFNLNIGLVATVASFLVAAIWGFDSLSSIRPMLQAGLILRPDAQPMSHPKVNVSKPETLTDEKPLT